MTAKRFKLLRWMPIGAFGILLTGCASLSPQKVAAHKIAEELPRVIGPAKRYEVHVEGDPFALVRGHAREIRGQGEEVRIAPGIVLDTLDFQAENISFDSRSKELKHIGQVNFVATLSQEELGLYLAEAHPRSGLNITLRQSDLEVRLPVAAGSLHTSITLDGILIPSTPGGDTVDFVADRAHLSFLPVPVILVRQALDRINPVLDLTQFKIPVSLQSTDVKERFLVLRGTADLDAPPQPAGAS